MPNPMVAWEAKEQGSQKQMEELVDDWIDRELTPVIQKQVSCRGLQPSVYLLD